MTALRKAAALSMAIGVGLVMACNRQPSVDDASYREAVVAFYTGLAALQTSQDVLARQNLERVTTLAPNEPAAWADLGLLLLRQQDLDGASERLTKAADLAPTSGDVQRLIGLVESRRGNLPAAVRAWKRALQVRADDGKAAFALALDLERQNTGDALLEAERVLDSLAGRTSNLVARLEYVRIAAKRGDRVAAMRGVAALAGPAASWPADIQARFTDVQQAPSLPALGQSIAFLKNVLLREPAYRAAYAALTTPRAEAGEPIARLLTLPNPPAQPAPIDDGLSFAVQPAGDLPASSQWAGVIWPRNDAAPLLASSDGTGVRLTGGIAWTQPGPGGASLGRDAIVFADFNFDFRTDIAFAGPRGLELLRQDANGRFASVTAESRLPAAVLSSPVYGVWAADVDTDGDLDTVEALVDGPPRVLRNNGDGTFAVQQPFAGVERVRGFVWADFDGDGVPDAAMIDAAGATRVFLNARAGAFVQRQVPAFPKAVAITAAEITGDAIVDLVVLTDAGAVLSIAGAVSGFAPGVEVARWPGGSSTVGAAGLLTADVDNNGAIDIVIANRSASSVVLRGPAGATRLLAQPIALDVRAAADVDGDGRVDLVGVQPGGPVAVARSRGTKPYHWQVVRPHAATVTGDQRINSFGIGGEIEVRTGLHAQKQIITAPVVHVGLGEATASEVIRINWPNGTLQSEFNAAADASIAANQRLKGSCPWLFAWNGREMAFVTDVLWRSPLGLRINAQTTADVLMTEDWVRLRGDQLQPRGGVYDLRITAELWETHFFDLASLMVVDHPVGTEVFVDERFAVPAPKLGVTVTGPVQPVASARDDGGRDVAADVLARDDRYLDTFGRGAYQGVTRDHFVEVEIPDSAPRSGPLWLVAQGWIHPTDSSINVALGQGSHPAPRGLSLEVADAQGRFRTVRPNLGFPAGKDKTVLIDLDGVLPRTGPRRLRLSTNLEVFWDRVGWAVGRPDAAIEVRRLPLESANLGFRGYSVTDQRDSSTPERPRYAVEGTEPRWRDLEGYYTRFGDVRELLTGVDDRYVIMNAGDELTLTFKALAPAGTDRSRDFVMITDGWEKDGDINTTFSRTVLPLPTHASGRYDRPPGRLEQDPIYLRHPQDFATYHTRYVTPDASRDALRR